MTRAPDAYKKGALAGRSRDLETDKVQVFKPV